MVGLLNCPLSAVDKLDLNAFNTQWMFNNLCYARNELILFVKRSQDGVNMKNPRRSEERHDYG